MLKKLPFFLLAFFFYATVVSSKSISSDVAKTVAANFFKQNAAVQIKNISLAYAATSLSGDTLYFVFNVNTAGGFVIVVADDAQYPVIGYSTEGAFVLPAASSNAGAWMENRKSEIVANKAMNVQATADISAKWTAYINNSTIASRSASVIVPPLLQTLWDQPYPYSALCPGGSVTGCVATTMAQIMRFWKYPLKGSGSSSYHSDYGALSANYGNTAYLWNDMPAGNVLIPNNEVATLMYQCGVSVEMEYSPDASGAAVTTYDDPYACAQIAYSKYFGYNASTIKGMQRFDFSDASWIDSIEKDLNAGRPVEYAAYDTSFGGHTWVCDGYDADNNIHMNWGWSGADNGYFSVNLLNPGNVSGHYNFIANHEMLTGIEPKAPVTNDAGILSVMSPGGTGCSSSVTPVVQLQNFGSSALTSCSINYKVDAGTVNTFNWTGTLLAGQSVSVTLPAISVSSGTHNFTSSTSKPNNVTDGNSGNDQLLVSFTVASAPLSLPLSQGFEGLTTLPAGWSIWNPDSDVTWQLVGGVSRTGTNSIGMDNCDGDGYYDMKGTKDRFITMPYNFANQAQSTLSFDVAYAPVNFYDTLYTDTLAVYYSTDCGSSWTRAYIKGGATLATTSTYYATPGACWYPTTSSEWRTDAIDLSVLSGQESVMFAFENHSGWGSWVFIDNINISQTTAVASIPDAESFHIYPNPANSLFTIEGPGSREHIHYSLYNIVGKELKTGDIASDGSRFSQTIQVSDLAQGMYFLTVLDDGHVWTSKVEVR